jgi:hypothetical protein
MTKRILLPVLRAVVLVAALGALFLGCSNVFAPKIEKRRDSGGDGNGTVRIDIEGASSSSRTLLPAAAGGFTRHDLLFQDQAELLPDKEAPNYTSGDPVTLAEGSWTVTVNAFLPYGEGGHRLAASGTAPVTVVAGEAGDPVPVVLRPVDNADTCTGNGTFAWDMSFPEITGTVTVEITDLQGNVVQTLSLKGSDLLDGTLSDGKDRSQGSIELPAGSYYARTTLTRGTGESPPKARRKDALFILEGMTTLADGAAGYAFTAGSFSRTLHVTSAADSGAGSLRQALADAGADDTILIALPPGSVIALETSLSSSKSLTIEGNGVTLTRGAGLTDRLLNINGAEVAIRRIHFKDGLSSSYGAAINSSAGFLALESCVFSGNKVSAANSWGGAVYFGGTVSTTLNVLGCTFYNNTSGGYGGAICIGGNSSLKLGGESLLREHHGHQRLRGVQRY